MKKLINNSDNIVMEMIEGFLAAFGSDYKKVNDVTAVVKKNLKTKVSIVTGGGSGHEPLFIGAIGDGLADGVALGNIFAAPNPNTILELTKAVNVGKGVLYIYGNYSGDILNFDMAAELADFEDIEVKTILVRDDVASAPKEHKHDRRGIAGDIFVLKIAGAASEDNLSLEEVHEVAQKAADNTFSIGIALASGSLPNTGRYNFELPENEIEFGMGLHGEPGIRREKFKSADEITHDMMDLLLQEAEIQSGEEIALLVNGLGSTTLMELMIVNRKVNQILQEQNIKIHHNDIGNYCTSQEMAGFSITIMKLDEKLKRYLDEPAYSPFYKKRC